MNDEPPRLILDPFTILVLVILLIVIAGLCSSCSFYRERFTYYPTAEKPGHVVDVTHVSVFQVGKAARLTTSTQTEEFIRDVNAVGIESKTDGQALGDVLKRIVRPTP